MRLAMNGKNLESPKPLSAPRPLLLAGLVLSGMLGLGLASGTAAPAGTEPGVPPVAGSKYIGADKCKSCHSAAESGDQYGHWKSSSHAKAFEVLASDEAKKLGAEKGIADPQKDDACVKCHVTAFKVAEDQIKKGFDMKQGVQCETCHGPGEAHMKARFAAASAGDPPPEGVKIGPDEILANPGEKTCLACHNSESPSYKPFCFHEFSAKIRHLNPKKGRTTLDVGPCSCPKCASGCPDECKKLAEVK